MVLCIWHDRQAARTKAVLEMQVGPAMVHMPLADHGTVSWALSRFTVAQPFPWISLHRDLVVAVGGTEGQTGERFTRKDQEDFLTN